MQRSVAPNELGRVDAPATVPDAFEHPEGGERSVSASWRERASRLVRWESGLVLALAGTISFGVSSSAQFAQSSNIFNMGLSDAVVALMALPMTLVIISGEIDLSIASTLALSSSLLGYLWSHHWPMPAIIVTVLVVGVVLGLVNGLLVTRVGLPSLAVTIGTMTLYGGIAEIILGPTIVSNFPSTYTTIGSTAFPHTPFTVSTVVFIVLAVAFAALLHFTSLGRATYAIGANSETAAFSGIRVKRVKTVLFAVSGLIGASAGVIYTFQLSTATYTNGTSLLLPVIAIVLVGGVSIFGGKGTLIGVILAILVYSTLENALLLTNFPENALGMVTGGLLLVSVVVPNGKEILSRLRMRSRLVSRTR